MADKSDEQEASDDIEIILHKFRSVTTIEPVVNATEQAKTLRTNNSESPSGLSDIKPTNVDDNNAAVRRLPELNLPEKILFIIDTARAKNFSYFVLGTGARYSPLFMIKRVVENFISAKSTFQRNHEYALMILDHEGSHWICDFTNNTKTLVNHLDTIVEHILDGDPKTFDLGQAFKCVQAKVPLPAKTQSGAPPSFVSRVILIYTRSESLPKFQTGQKSFESLMENPYFFLDVLFVHEVPCAVHACEEVYSEITALDTTGFSYILEVGRNAAKLHNSMAKLLAHPLQRPPQKDTCYTVYSPPPLQEVHTTV